MIKNIERISNETRDLVNQFFVDNWFSTDMSIRGEIIDGTKLDGFLLQEENTIMRLITTNDNMRALQFYQKRGYYLTKLYPNAMEEVFNFLRKCGIFYLATEEGDKPRVRPFGAINIFDGKLYIQTGKSKNVSKQMQINPNVEISGFVEENWIRLEGKVVRDDSREAKVSMLDNNPELKSMYSVDDDNTEVLYFENAKATFCSFTEEPKVIEF